MGYNESMKKKWLSQLKQKFPHLDFQTNFSLAKYTYFQIGGPAEVFVKAEFVQDIQDLVAFSKKNQIPLTVIGAGSNIVVADEGIKGLVLSPINKELEQLESEKNKMEFRAGAGLMTTQLARKTSKAGATGLESFVGVPGTLGGAVYNNSHYQGALIGNYITQVQVVDFDGNLSWVPAEECNFAYEQSRFQTSNEVIVQVDFLLEKGNVEEAREKMKVASKYRAETQPTQPSCGCVFQNVKNNDHLRELFPQFAGKEFVSAGFLIDQAGLKGLRQGGVEVSDKHAAFLINKGEGTATDVKKITKMIKDKIFAKFKVKLEEEVFYLGD